MDPQRAGVDLDATIDVHNGATAATGAKFDTTIKVADVGTLRARQRPGSDRAAPAEDSAAEDDYADDFEMVSVDGASMLAIKFDEQCRTEDGCDYLFVGETEWDG